MLIRLSFSLLLIFAQPVSGVCQEFTEGRVVYDITFPELDMDESIRGSLPRESTVYVKGYQSRTDIDVGPRMSSSSIYNAQTGEVTALTEFMDSKTYIVMKPGSGPVPSNNSTQVVLVDNQNKNIAGYVCKKAIMKGAENVSSDLYYTDKIKARLAVNVQFPGVDGFPMEFLVDQNGLKMRYTVREVISEAVSSSLFTVPPDYKLVTPEDLMQIYKATEGYGKDGEIKEIQLPPRGK